MQYKLLHIYSKILEILKFKNLRITSVQQLYSEQKNTPEITGAIVSQFDWALTESCGQSGQDWCSQMKPYSDQNKAIFAAEYSDNSFDKACS
jgi:glycosyl hydrolase family 114